MKKLIFPLIVLGGFLLLGTNVAEAQNVGFKKVQTIQTDQSGFVDTNNDGICDKSNGSQPEKGLGPGNGQALVATKAKDQVKVQDLETAAATNNNAPTEAKLAGILARAGSCPMAAGATVPSLQNSN